MAHQPKYVAPEFKTQPLQAVAAGKAGTPEVVSAAGALSLDTRGSQISITGGVDIAMTLPAGDEDQEKTIVMTAKGGAGNAVLTPSALVTGTTITFNAVGDAVVLKFLGGKWHVVYNNSCVVA